MKHRFYVLIAFIFLFSFGLKAQKQIIKGTVVNEDSEPLIGASISIPSEETGTITDIDGNFQIESEADFFIVSYTGFKSDTIFQPFLDSIKVIKDIGLSPSYSVTIVAEKYLIPHANTNLERKDIQKIPSINVQEMYNKIPGIYMHAGALNTNRMTIRGVGARSPFSTQKIRAFINDIPLTNGLGESNLEDINLGIIDDINIIKGPAAPEYGSALGGTILYKTNRYIRDRRAVKGLFEYGSFNTFHGNVNANFSHKKTVFSLNQDYISSDGYRDNNQVNRYNLSAFSSTEWKNDVLTVFFNHTNLNGEIPSSLNIEDFENDPSSAAANWEAVNGNEVYNRQMIGVNHKKEINEKWLTSTSLFFNRFDSEERRPFNTALVNSFNNGGRFVLQYGLNNQAFNIKIGGEYFRDNDEIELYETDGVEQGEFLSTNDETRLMGNGFVIANIPLKDFMIETGLSANTIIYRLRSEVPGSVFILNKFYAPIVSPHFSVSYRPRLNQLYFFNLSQGFSSPSLQSSQDPIEFYNVDLQREVGINAELGSRIKIKGYELEAAIYSFWVNNLVLLENVGPDIFESRNAGQTLHPGVEFSGNKNCFIQGGHTIRADISYQYTPHRFIRFANNETEVDGNFLPGNPQQKLFLGLSYEGKYFSSLIEHHYVGETFANDLNTIKVDAYHITNFRIESGNFLNYNFNSMKVYFQLNNVFNSQYASMVAVNPSSFGGNLPRYLYPGLPRNFNLGVSLKFNQ